MSAAIRANDMACAAELLTAATASNLSVYVRHYQAGLREALERCYQVTRRLLGPDNFRYFARRYSAAHPPHAASIDHFGELFPEHLAREPELLQTQRALAHFAKLDWFHHHPIAPAVLELELPTGLIDAYEEVRSTGDLADVRFGSPQRYRLVRSER